MPCQENCSCSEFYGCDSKSESESEDECDEGETKDEYGNCRNCPDGCTECSLKGNSGFKCKKCTNQYEDMSKK